MIRTSLACVLLAGAAVLSTTSAEAGVQTARPSSQKLISAGVVNLTSLAAGRIGLLPNAARELGVGGTGGANSDIAIKPSPPQTRVIPLRLPGVTVRHQALAAYSTDRQRAIAIAVATTAASPLAPVTGFNGLDQADQRNADSGNQYSLEPPDQALASDGRYVVEAVNNAISVYDIHGKQLTAPVSTNRFFNLQSEITRSTGEYGPSLSDPRAFYDPDSKRWFVFEWALSTYADGQLLGYSQQFFAVSETSNPTGNWRIYNFDTTNANVSGCPCLPDFQQIGFNKAGIFVTHNLFGLFGAQQFAGVSVYALSKAGVVANTGTPIVEFLLPNDFTVHPTILPPGGVSASAEGGTQYFLESLADLSNTGAASSVRVFALSGTDSLGAADPSTISLSLNSVDVATQTYQEPFPVAQPDGPRPYAASLVKAEAKLPPVPLLDGGSARLSSNPYFSAGNIWGVVTTGITSASGAKNGLAYFVVSPTGGATTLSASLTTQGVITAPGAASLFYGAIAMPSSGRGGIGFSLAGPGNYPSSGVATLSIIGAGTLQLTGIGAQPDDGFTGYTGKPFTQGVGRWGDYAAAAALPNGRLIFGNEYIPDSAVYPRTTFANWGTFITTLRP